MKWYVVHLLFAQKEAAEKRAVKCESCQVLFEAESALAAYEKSLIWADAHSTDTPFHFVGVEHIHSLDNEKPGDGTEIGGAFFDSEDIWERKDQLIPEKSRIAAILWEENIDTPIKDMMTQEQIKNVREVYDN